MVFFINLPIPKLMNDSANLTITYCKRVLNYLHTSESSILNVHQADKLVSCFNSLHLEDFSADVNDPKNAAKRKAIEVQNKF